MKKSLCFLTLTAVFGGSAYAQEGVPKFEATGDYSYMQFNPTITGLQSRAYNGGGGQGQFNFNRYFGIKGDFQGYGSSSWTYNVTSPIGTSAGIIPIGKYTTRANMFTYMFGPVVGVHASRFTVFSEVLFGGSHTSGYIDLENQVIAGGGKLSKNPDQHPFTMAFGGGVDLNAGKHVAIRLGEMDYVLTRYTNPLTSTNNQNNFRYLGGVIFRFGGE
ncbi:MAG TPA: outer membrane beta-barrel protein [Bryobacteraceae bacterium]|nr:outer membrane beta-barrel protein [Bryobacteraceae bacterium]